MQREAASIFQRINAKERPRSRTYVGAELDRVDASSGERVVEEGWEHARPAAEHGDAGRRHGGRAAVVAQGVHGHTEGEPLGKGSRRSAGRWRPIVTHLAGGVDGGAALRGIGSARLEICRLGCSHAWIGSCKRTWGVPTCAISSLSLK